MAKKFNFKLESLLKVRRFKEEKLTQELGKINQEIMNVKNKVEDLKGHIDEVYKAQESAFQTGADGQFARFFPYYIQAKREDIEVQKNLIYALTKRYDRKLEEVRHAMGETKVIDEMKDKEKQKWKKENSKKEDMEIEEMINMRKKSSGIEL